MLTLDKGEEFRRFGESEIETGPSVYFPDTHSTWQSGNNENTNGLVRRYAPNGDDFSKVTEKNLPQSFERSIVDLANASATDHLKKSFRKPGVVRLECKFT